MKNNIQAPPPRQRDFFSQLISGGFAAFGLMLLFSVSSVQATPLADATISNRASADYTDTGGTPQHTLSNEVTTTVQQVGSYTLTTSNTKTAAPGTTVYMPHTLSNTGNGSDSFNISLPGAFDSTNLSGVSIFADANGDGLPDSATPLCKVGGLPSCASLLTGQLAPGGTFNFIVAMTVKATAGNVAVADEIVTVVPVTTLLYTTATLSNTDKLTVANNIPVFAVNKSIVSLATSGPTGSQVKYKIAYTNNGNAAGPLYIKDLIGSGGTAGYSYVAVSALWSSSGTTVLTDVANGDPTGVSYQAITVTGVTTVEAVVTNVAPNTSGFITITVSVDADALLGTSETTNTASYAVADTTSPGCSALVPCITPTGTPSITNQSPFTVLGSYGVVANNNTALGTIDINGHYPGDGDNIAATGNDLVSVTTPAAPGATVSFSNQIWNTGNSTDTFNITIADIIATGSKAFPVGTAFQLFKSDGSTPLVSSDADGILDTGPLPPGTSYTVVLKATIPADACSVAANCLVGNNATVSITAASKGDPTLKNTVFDQLATITPASVDLTNVGALGLGAGVVPGAVITDMAVTPGNTAYFNLNVTNKGTAIDNYNLDYHLLNAGSDLASAGAFAPGSLLSGWTVVFHANTANTGVCTASTLGAVVSNTGAVAPLATANYCAVVTTPATGATALAGTYKTYFQVTSGSTGASDIKLDSVTLTSLNKLSLITPGVGQIQPGGTILYPHSLINGGNSSCGGNFSFTVTNNKQADGWSYLLYQDNNANGTIEATDTTLGGGVLGSTITTTMSALTAGSQAKLLVKVQAPAGAVSGAVDVISITATDPVGTCGTTAPITETTNVLAGQVRLVKTQALGAWSGTACGVAGAYSGSVQSQKPGECIWYKIVATNEGDAPVSSVVINDTTPSFTAYGGGGTCSAGATLAAPSITLPVLSGISPPANSIGIVKCATWATLAPAATSTLEFSVRINP
jgi:uncharacterized repeat protein (TIGR01451 family)